MACFSRSAITEIGLVIALLSVTGCAAPLVSAVTGSGAGAATATTTESASKSVASSATSTVVTETVKSGLEDRSTANQIADASIKAAIAKALLDEGAGMFVDASTDVWEQRVMLTGSVETAADKKKAGDIAAATEDVEVVFNDIIVTSKDSGVGGMVDDVVIQTKIEAKLLAAKGVNSLNYRWRSVDGRVFVTGRALSADEHEKVKAVINDTEDVSSVTSHIVVQPREEGEKPSEPQS